MRVNPGPTIGDTLFTIISPALFLLSIIGLTVFGVVLGAVKRGRE